MVVNLYNCATVIAQLFLESVDVRFAQAHDKPNSMFYNCKLQNVLYSETQLDHFTLVVCLAELSSLWYILLFAVVYGNILYTLFTDRCI